MVEMVLIMSCNNRTRARLDGKNTLKPAVKASAASTWQQHTQKKNIASWKHETHMSLLITVAVRSNIRDSTLAWIQRV